MNLRKVCNTAFVLVGCNDAKLCSYPFPDEPKSGEVLCKTLAVGICGSDVSLLTKGRCGSFFVEKPLILGHETAAEIVKCGPEVYNVEVGDLVAIEPSITCDQCEFCLNGLYNLCPTVKYHAAPPIDGTLIYYFLHPAKHCFRVSNQIPVEFVAMIEPLAVAVHGCNRVNIKPNQSTILITGAGAIGLLTLQVAKVYGAKRIIVTEINSERLEMAKQLGADGTLLFQRSTSENEMLKQIYESFHNNLPTISIECSGVGANFRLVMLATKPGGTCLFVGSGPEEYQLPIASAAQRELTMLGHFRFRYCYPKAIELVTTGLLKLAPLITHKFDFKNSLDAYQTAASGKGIKIMIMVQPFTGKEKSKSASRKQQINQQKQQTKIK